MDFMFFLCVSIMVGTGFIIPFIIGIRNLRKTIKQQALAKQLTKPENKLQFSKKLKIEIKKHNKNVLYK